MMRPPPLLDHVALILVAVPPGIVAAAVVAIGLAIVVAPVVVVVAALVLVGLVRLPADRLLQLIEQLFAERTDLLGLLRIALRVELLLDGGLLRRRRAFLPLRTRRRCGWRLRRFLLLRLLSGLLLASLLLLLLLPALAVVRLLGRLFSGRLLWRGLLRCRRLLLGRGGHSCPSGQGGVVAGAGGCAASCCCGCCSSGCCWPAPAVAVVAAGACGRSSAGRALRQPAAAGRPVPVRPAAAPPLAGTPAPAGRSRSRPARAAQPLAVQAAALRAVAGLRPAVAADAGACGPVSAADPGPVLRRPAARRAAGTPALRGRAAAHRFAPARVVSRRLGRARRPDSSARMAARRRQRTKIEVS